MTKEGRDIILRVGTHIPDEAGAKPGGQGPILTPAELLCSSHVQASLPGTVFGEALYDAAVEAHPIDRVGVVDGREVVESERALDPDALDGELLFWRARDPVGNPPPV